MRLKVVGSGSTGNAYIIYNDNEALLLECGVNFSHIKQALNFNLRKVIGCLVTHCHLDHCKGVKEASKAGIDIYCLPETANEFKGVSAHRIHTFMKETAFTVGGFKVIPFPLVHNVPSVGFLIEHKETGRFCFITDTCYTEYTFPGLNNVIVEANYCDRILSERLVSGSIDQFLGNRIIKDHMSIETCKKFLSANNLKAVNNILLIHLSDGNSDAKRFQKEVRDLTACTVSVASKGLDIDFNKSPF